MRHSTPTNSSNNCIHPPIPQHRLQQQRTHQGGSYAKSSHCHFHRPHLPHKHRRTRTQSPSHHLFYLLNARLADSTDLRTQVKWAHWNVKGLHFMQLHKFSIPSRLISKTRLTQSPSASLPSEEWPRHCPRSRRQVRPQRGRPLRLQRSLHARITAVHNVAHHANAVRTAIQESDDLGDATTADLFTQLSRELDKDLWFLEAHLTQS